MGNGNQVSHDAQSRLKAFNAIQRSRSYVHTVVLHFSASLQSEDLRILGSIMGDPRMVKTPSALNILRLNCRLCPPSTYLIGGLDSKDTAISLFVYTFKSSLMT